MTDIEQIEDSEAAKSVEPQAKATTSRWHRALVAVLAVLIMSGAVQASSIQPASAAPSNAGIYLVAPQWGGYCPKGPGILRWNKVKHVRYVNHTTGDSWGDSGDDIVWARVRLHTTNTITVAVTCRWNTPQGMNFRIRPTRSGQTAWTSTWGQHWLN